MSVKGIVLHFLLVVSGWKWLWGWHFLSANMFAIINWLWR